MNLLMWPFIAILTSDTTSSSSSCERLTSCCMSSYPLLIKLSKYCDKLCSLKKEMTSFSFLLELDIAVFSWSFDPTSAAIFIPSILACCLFEKGQPALIRTSGLIYRSLPLFPQLKIKTHYKKLKIKTHYKNLKIKTHYKNLFPAQFLCLFLCQFQCLFPISKLDHKKSFWPANDCWLTLPKKTSCGLAAIKWLVKKTSCSSLFQV